jgi:hypothetical protein
MPDSSMYKFVKTPPRLDPFLDAFADLFTKPSHDSFCQLVIAIAVCATSKTVSSLHKTISNSNGVKKSRSLYNWFFNGARWDENEVAQRNAKLFFKAVGLKIGDLLLLIIDDTYNKKKGTCTEGVGRFYDHSKGHIWGNNFVTSVLQLKDAFIPHKAKMYIKKDDASEDFRTKLQIAFEDIIKPLVIPEGVKLMIVFDSWWFSSGFINDCRELGYHVTCRIKSDKLVVPDDGFALQVQNYVKKFNTHDCEITNLRVRGKKKMYFTIERIVKLDKIGDVKLVISKRKKDKNPTYYICTNTCLSSVEILSIYEDRWNIETAHREANQKLGFKDYQLRHKKAIERFIQLVFTIWTGLLLLELDKPRKTNRLKTIGEMVLDIRADVVIENIKYIFEKFNLSIPDSSLLYVLRDGVIKT